MTIADIGGRPVGGGPHGGGRDRRGAQEIGFAEIQALIRRGWKLIALCAVLAGVAAVLALNFLVPTLYLASANLLITPLDERYSGASTAVGLYRSLAISDGLITKTTRRLVADGVLAESTVLLVGRELDALVAAANSADQQAFLVLNARHAVPETAATIVNAWAEAVVAEGRGVFHGTAAGSENLLGSQLDPTNAELEAAGAELSAQLAELGEREEQVTVSWDRRISAARKQASEAVAAYHTAKRRLMTEAVARLLPPDPAGASGAVRSKLEEVVSVRAQLARSPRVLTLEKAASEDALTELLAQGQSLESYDLALKSDEINPLYDELTLKVLELETELKALAGAVSGPIGRVLAELERIELERSAGLLALDETNRLDLRVLQLRRGRDLEALHLEELQVRNKHNRRVKQLDGLADELSGQLNRSVVSRVLEEVEVVKLALPAAPPQTPISRQMLIKTMIAVFLGGLLGLMITLFRSARPAA